MSAVGGGMLQVRDVGRTDIDVLARLKPPVALHRDRLRDAEAGALQYCVIEAEGAIVGFGCLVFRRPATWSDAGDARNVPEIVDLFVTPEARGRGVASYFVRALEARAVARGEWTLFLAVSPQESAAAHRLYERLGYRALDPVPFRKQWAFVDLDGAQHSGSGWVIEMARDLRRRDGA